MICCDLCGEWYHFKCVGIKENTIAKTTSTHENESLYVCSKCKNHDTAPDIAPLWFPSGPSFDFFPYPVIDTARPWGQQCKDCGGPCSGHYVTDIKKLSFLRKNNQNVRALPPSTIIEEAFQSNKKEDDEELPLQSIAMKCCLKEEEVKLWWDHLTTTSINRARGTEKAKATRARKRKALNS